MHIDARSGRDRIRHLRNVFGGPVWASGKSTSVGFGNNWTSCLIRAREIRCSAWSQRKFDPIVTVVAVDERRTATMSECVPHTYPDRLRRSPKHLAQHMDAANQRIESVDHVQSFPSPFWRRANITRGSGSTGWTCIASVVNAEPQCPGCDPVQTP